MHGRQVFLFKHSEISQRQRDVFHFEIEEFRVREVAEVIVRGCLVRVQVDLEPALHDEFRKDTIVYAEESFVERSVFLFLWIVEDL